ncbi:glucose-6-phosphate isomerase [Nematocida sp. LUAm3]|nr:glucose-6-phosphate isomerase [Nematocida sp. LUAm3]KAI5173516.1 glucose-6-phosphate isomerase [Nematocida sp. LUAm2]KAI5176737.1 glucose-6-phosphate isomerase [Nematocida sp. LUAm1]
MKHLRELFEEPERAEKYTKSLVTEHGSILLDFSKTHVEQDTVTKWIDTLEEIKISSRIKEMFSGDKINYSENRKVLHVKLRAQSVISAVEKSNTSSLDAEEEQIAKELLTMKRIEEQFASETLLGISGKPLKHVVSIGIGGSDLGPRLLTSALSPISPTESTFSYVSNVDAQEILSVVNRVNIEETLFIVVSKTFTTQETLENAKIAVRKVKEIFPNSDQKEIAKKHFLAVTAAKQKAEEFGISSENILDMWDFVGGRYSIWSCVSLSSVLAIGFSSFLEFLRGASEMDMHFLNAPPRSNLPMLHAMAENYYYNGYGVNNKCIVPYDYFLKLLPSYLQQCEMESNGKSCRKSGDILVDASFMAKGVPPEKQTGAIIWGGTGTDVQHSYFQLLHQGTVRILTEFLFPIKPKKHSIRDNTESSGTSTAHDVLFSNCLAQSRALMLGKEEERERYFSGNRPSITVLYNELSPYTLGMLISLYEHKIFVQGQVWSINSYDQFGVELGKVLAKDILSQIEKGTQNESMDSSSSSLLLHYAMHRDPQ